MNKESYFRDKISKIESAIEDLKLCYEWFSYEDITSKINHLESEAEKLKNLHRRVYQRRNLDL